MKSLNEMKRSLTEQQVKAVNLLIENEIDLRKSKTQEDIAQEVGITRKQLYVWRTQDTDFIAYKDALADQVLAGHHEKVIAKLLQSIDNGSVKAMDLYFSVRGKKVSKSEVTHHSSGAKPALTDAEVQRELAKLNESING